MLDRFPQLRERLLGREFWQRRQAVRSDVLGGAVIMPPEHSALSSSVHSSDSSSMLRRRSNCSAAATEQQPYVVDVSGSGEHRRRSTVRLLVSQGSTGAANGSSSSSGSTQNRFAGRSSIFSKSFHRGKTASLAEHGSAAAAAAAAAAGSGAGTRDDSDRHINSAGSAKENLNSSGRHSVLTRYNTTGGSRKRSSAVGGRARKSIVFAVPTDPDEDNGRSDTPRLTRQLSSSSAVSAAVALAAPAVASLGAQPKVALVPKGSRRFSEEKC
jgi:hypothetical protein